MLASSLYLGEAQPTISSAQGVDEIRSELAQDEFFLADPRAWTCPHCGSVLTDWAEGDGHCDPTPPRGVSRHMRLTMSPEGLADLWEPSQADEHDSY